MSLSDDAVRGIANVEMENILCDVSVCVSPFPESQILMFEPPPWTLEVLLDRIVEARESYKIPGRGL